MNFCEVSTGDGNIRRIYSRSRVPGQESRSQSHDRSAVHVITDVTISQPTDPIRSDITTARIDFSENIAPGVNAATCTKTRANVADELRQHCNIPADATPHFNTPAVITPRINIADDIHVTRVNISDDTSSHVTIAGDIAYRINVTDDAKFLASGTTCVDREAPDTMLRAEDVKEEFLVCGICTREFNEDVYIPRILPCLHTYCQLCLKKLSKGKTIACPMCKQEHTLPKGDVLGFAKDTTRRNLIDFIKVRKRSSDILCKDCPEEQTAKDFCKDCYIFMCPDCTKAHKRSLASRKHSVLTIKELQKSGIDVFRRKLLCPKHGHEGQQLAFYCTKKGCETSICTACTVCDHDRSNGHVIINIQDIYKVKQAEMDKQFKSLDKDISSAKIILQQTEREILNLDIKELEIEKDIDDTFEHCRLMLAKRQEKLKGNLAVLCEQKKQNVQKYVEVLENYVDSAANAKDFSEHVLSHTDPTEFVPLHTTLLQRLKTMSNMKVDPAVLNIESPVFENKEMEAEFQQYVNGLGKLGTSMQQKRLSISRGHTHIGMPMSSTSSRAGYQDKRFGDLLCPGFSFDTETVHHYREISDNRRVLRNFSTIQKSNDLAGGRRLKKYRGVVASRAFQQPGKYYFEVFVNYHIIRSLDNINFVFEIGISERDDIDNGYYVYDQQHAWSFCAQHCDEHQRVCLWCRHNGRNFTHVQLTTNCPGTKLERTFGFLFDADRRLFTVVDVSKNRTIHTFQGVNANGGLWPVFGCHWPSKVKLEMKLRTGRDIESVPQVALPS